MLNEHGALGHGDRNPRLRPRFVEKLKGLKVERVICGTHLTYFIDVQGQVYVCGKGFELFPKRIEFFTKEKVRIKDVAIAHDRVVGSFVPEVHAHLSDLPLNLVFFISDIGEVYWTSPQSPIPQLFNPASELFVVQAALTERSVTFLTAQGQLYSWYAYLLSLQLCLVLNVLHSGRWAAGECGNIPLSESGALSEKDADGLPLKLTRVWVPAETTIVFVCSAISTTVALDDQGQVWYYGGYASSLPTIPLSSLSSHCTAPFRLFSIVNEPLFLPPHDLV